MQTIPVQYSDEIEEDRPMPSVNHSIISQNIGGELYRYRSTVSTHQQLSLNLDGWQTVPDVCCYSRDVIVRNWTSDQDECSIAPSLVIEVLSPKQNLQPLLDKVRDYLRHGVRNCWVIVPGTRTISEFPQSGPSRTVCDGVLRDEHLGIEVNVAAIFEE